MQREERALSLHREGKIIEAKAIYEEILAYKPSCPIALSNLGLIYKSLNQARESEQLFRRSLSVNPDCASTLHNLSNLMSDEGRYCQAIELEKKAISLVPDFEPAYLTLSECLRLSGRPEEAIQVCKSALANRLDSELVKINLTLSFIDAGKFADAKHIMHHCIGQFGPSSSKYAILARIHLELGDYEGSIQTANRALAISPAEFDALLVKAKACLASGDVDAASNCIDMAEAINTKSSECRLLKAHVMRARGDMKLANQLYEDTISAEPHCAAAYFGLSLDSKYKWPVTYREQLFADSFSSGFLPADLIFTSFARAHILHEEKDYHGSAQNLIAANSFKLDLYPSDVDTYLSEAARLKSLSDIFTCDPEVSHQSAEAARHIFIVGLPRCGSTLLETLLEGSPYFKSCGETSALHKAYAQVSREVVDDYSSQMSSLGAIYRNKIKGACPTDSLISIDKQLYNYMLTAHICKFIPGARVVWCYRHPLDHLLSIYRAHFVSGSRYSSDVSEAARLLLDSADNMIDYYRSYSDLIYRWSYEDLVNDPEDSLLGLMTWLGLDWKSEFLNTAGRERTVTTASIVQARRPVSNKSLRSWKNYKALFEEVLPLFKSHPFYREFNYE